MPAAPALPKKEPPAAVQPPVRVQAQAQAQAQGVPPGSWFNNSRAPMQAQYTGMQQQHVPRRFPGHFMPHRLCNHFSGHGWCRMADACTFAHGMQELHPSVHAQMGAQAGQAPMKTIVVKGKGKGKMVGVNGKGHAAVETADYASKAAAEAAGGEEAIAEELALEADQFANFQFNTGAQVFVPLPAAPEVPAEEPAEAQGAGPSEGAGDEDSISPGRRRPQPQPLQLDNSPQQTAATAGALPLPSPASLILSQPLASPLNVATRTLTARQPLSSPKVVMVSPTRYLGAGAGIIQQSLTSPKAILVGSNGLSASFPSLAMPSPKTVVVAARRPSESTLPLSSAEVTTKPASAQGTAPAPAMTLTVLSSPTSAAAAAAVPGAQFVLRSPCMGAVSPSGQAQSPMPISRGMLLQARTVVQKLEQGPPGLAHCAPTPTTKAQKFGFQYPQPGWFSTIAAPPAQGARRLSNPN